MTRGAKRWRTRTWVVVILVTFAVGGAEGYFARRQYDAQQRQVFDGWRARLTQAAGEHARLIGSWAAGALADARVVASYPSVVELLADATRAAPGKQVPGARQAHVSDVVGSFVRLQRYQGACLVDGLGRPVVVSGEPLAGELIARIRDAVLGSGGDRIDLFVSNGHSVVVAAIPVSSGESGSAGLVLLAADPSVWLYPEVLSDAFAGKTGESLLVREEGGRSVLLSPAHRLVKPVPTHAFRRIRVPAATAGGTSTDEDDRGVQVIAAARPVVGTPWTVVAKIDRTEVLDGLQGAARGALMQSATYTVLLLAIVFALLSHRQAVHAAEQLKAAKQIEFLNRLLLTLSEVNELMVREKDRQRLLEETCRIVVERAGFRMAWVGEVRPRAHVTPVASAGAVEGYLEGIDIRYDGSPTGHGPSGTAIRERRTVAVDDVAADPLMTPWRDGALLRGYRSLVTVPIVVADRVFGVFVVYSTERRIFHGEALSLLERLAHDMAFALEVMERQARHLETEQALREREEQLRQAQKMEAIGRLAGGVAHDFNNLLMAISGYAELALSAKTEESRRERIEEIAIAAERAAALTRQLLAFSRKQVLQPRVVNLNSVVAEIEKMLVRLIGENVELFVRLASALHNVRVDPGQMEQVLVNLAVNARDAMPDGGRLVIQTANVEVHEGDGTAGDELRPGPCVVLTVTDSGHGMTEDVLDHIFEPFFTTKDSGRGTGLGLSMVYGIVKQSGGAITVESLPGDGCTFRVYLPAAAAEDEELSQAEPAPAMPVEGGRLLVVEDNAAVRRFVVEALQAAGYDVVDAASAESGIDLLEKDTGPIDLLLTDVVLPKMDGYELASRATAARPELRVVYMSGYVDSPKLRDLALKEGIDLIEKPFTSAAIVARVGRALEKRDPQKA
jgi:signal transduction histidine kinase/CheY-like chemotaxis protein